MHDKPAIAVTRWTNSIRACGSAIGDTRQSAAESDSPLDNGRSKESARSTEQIILEAVQLSLESSDALTALAQIELHFADPPSARSRTKLDELLDAWARALVGIDADELEALKREFSERCEST